MLVKLQQPGNIKRIPDCFFFSCWGIIYWENGNKYKDLWQPRPFSSSPCPAYILVEVLGMAIFNMWRGKGQRDWCSWLVYAPRLFTFNNRKLQLFNSMQFGMAATSFNYHLAINIIQADYSYTLLQGQAIRLPGLHSKALITLNFKSLETGLAGGFLLTWIWRFTTSHPTMGMKFVASNVRWARSQGLALGQHCAGFYFCQTVFSMFVLQKDGFCKQTEEDLACKILTFLALG